VLEATLVVRADGLYARVDDSSALWGPLFGETSAGDGDTIVLNVSQDGRPFVVAPAPLGLLTFAAGSGAPSVAVGVDGTIYLDVTSGRMYGPKAAGAWPSTLIGTLVRDATTDEPPAKGA
jgi:hypothetical protein